MFYHASESFPNFLLAGCRDRVDHGGSDPCRHGGHPVADLARLVASAIATNSRDCEGKRVICP